MESNWYAVLRPTRFLSDLLEQLLVEGQFGDQTMEADVPGIQFLESLGRVGRHAAVLVSPAVQGRRADAEPRADLGAAQVWGQIGLGLAELGDNLRWDMLSMGASKPATYGRFKTSQGLGISVLIHNSV